jgi:hypothetical protein
MARRYDAAVTPEVLSALKDRNIRFVLVDVAYDSKKVRTMVEGMGSFLVALVNSRNQKNQRNDA